MTVLEIEKKRLANMRRDLKDARERFEKADARIEELESGPWSPEAEDEVRGLAVLREDAKGDVDFFEVMIEDLEYTINDFS